MVRACFKKGQEWLSEKMHQLQSGGVRCRDRPKKTRSDVVQKDCWTRQQNKEDAMDQNKWRKLSKDIE